MFSPWLYNDWIYYLTSNGQEYFKLLRILHNFTNMVIIIFLDLYNLGHNLIMANIICVKALFLFSQSLNIISSELLDGLL